MEPNFYMLNHQKLLFMVGELHQRGFENLRVVPSLSPSGLSWRCSFINTVNRDKIEVIASNWIRRNYDCEKQEIARSIAEMADDFMEQEMDFLENCRGKNEEYVKWFQEMLQKLKPEELPYAFADYFSPTDYWQTSLRNRIPILPGEEKYYLGN